MSITNELFNQIESGRKGDSWGLSMGMPKFEQYIDGVTKGTFTLLFGASGSGKTSYALYAYIYRPLMDNLDNDNFSVIYYSLEMSRSILLGKLLSMYIAETFGYDISIKEMLGKNRNKQLTDEQYDILQKGKDWLEKIESKILLYDKALNADVMYSHLMKYLQQNGEFETKGNLITYHPKNPKKIILVVIDHMGLLRSAKGRTKKQEIDLACEYLLNLRNTCGISPLPIMQVNRDSSGMDRRNGGFAEPQRSDVKDSGGPEEACDVMIAIYDPLRDRMSSHRGYDIPQLQKKYRSIILLKSRYGEGDVAVGTVFHGKVGIWQELPKPTDIIDYTQYLNFTTTNTGGNTEIAIDNTKESKKSKLTL